MNGPNRLPDRYYHRGVEGRLIPHDVNPGPQFLCPTCGLLRHGADFLRDGLCMYCAAADLDAPAVLAPDERESLPDGWREGMRVLLVPDHSEGLGPEPGVLCSTEEVNGTVIVRVDSPSGPDDDGLREVAIDWVDPRPGLSENNDPCSFWERQEVRDLDDHGFGCNVWSVMRPDQAEDLQERRDAEDREDPPLRDLPLLQRVRQDGPGGTMKQRVAYALAQELANVLEHRLPYVHPIRGTQFWDVRAEREKVVFEREGDVIEVSIVGMQWAQSSTTEGLGNSLRHAVEHQLSRAAESLILRLLDETEPTPR